MERADRGDGAVADADANRATLQTAVCRFCGGLLCTRCRWASTGRRSGRRAHADWEVYPTTPWNYGVAVDEANPDVSVTFESRPVGDNPFSSEGAPVHARLKGWLVPEWIIEHSAAGPLPKSPIASTQPSTELTLIPYGSSRLRIAEFPVIGAP